MKTAIQQLVVILITMQIPTISLANYSGGKEKPIKDKETFGIFPAGKSGCDCSKNAAFKKMVNELKIEGINDTVYLYSENLSELKRFCTTAEDGIYLDIVVREQYGCQKPIPNNNFVFHEGEMLQPLYFSRLFTKNRASRNNFYVALNKIPDKYKGKNYMVNFGIIKARRACEYRCAKNVPGRKIDMLYLFPKYIYNEDLQMMADTFSATLNLQIPFKRNNYTVSASASDALINKLKIYGPYLKSVKIKTYSSVEGSTEGNLQLQKGRAAEINKIIQRTIGKKTEIVIESKENWEDFYNQTRNTYFNWLSQLSQKEIKKQLERKSLIDSIDILLDNNRIAEIEIRVAGQVDNNSPFEIILGAYKSSIDRNDTLRAYLAQNRLLDGIFKKNITRLEVLNIALPVNKMYLKLWTNYLALAATDGETNYYYRARDTAIKISKSDTTYAPIQFNFCILSLRYMQIYGDTMIPITVLEHKMNKAFKMAPNYADSTLVNHMWLNYSLLSLNNTWNEHSYDHLDRYLMMAKKYYPAASISLQEATSLGLLFNTYGYNKWTCELILPYIRRNHNDFSSNFLFVMTYMPEYELISHEAWVKYIKRAKSINMKYFYYWVNEFDFQNLRWPEIRDEFCSL